MRAPSPEPAGAGRTVVLAPMELMSVGAIAMGYAVAGLFFLRFWRDTRDRLFAFFALALFVLALNRVGGASYLISSQERELHTYWIRFAAFVLILVAILDKNRGRRSPKG